MNFLSIDDLSRDGISKIFQIADDIAKGKEGLAVKEHTTLALLFEKPSTRTRVSFEVAIAQLGGSSVYIDAQSSQLSRGETLSDTARVLSGYCDMIAARLYRQSDLVEIAINSTVPVINALTDLEHPTQALADVYTIRKYKKNLKNLKIAFIGDVGTNTANSLMVAASKLGAEISLVGPKGVIPNPIYFNKAKEYSKIHSSNAIEEGLEDVDIIYTDTFVSMGQEKDAEKRKKLFAPYQVNREVLDYAKRDALVMHCLPAHRGEEITAEILDGPRCIAWDQAKNKLLLNKAIIIYLSEQA